VFNLSLYAAIPATSFFVQLGVMIYIMLSVFIVLFRNSIRYYLLIPIPSLGLWMISTSFLSSFSFPILYPSLIISVFSIFFPAICHYFSRKRSIIGWIPMSYVSRSAIGLFSLVFFIFAINFLSSSPVQFDTYFLLNKEIMKKRFCQVTRLFANQQL